MNGDKLALRIRNILRDEPTYTDQGVFWSDREIGLSLNLAQDAMFSFFIKNKAYTPLYKLQSVMTSNSAKVVNLPTDYAQYISAQVSPSAISGRRIDSVSSYKRSLLVTQNLKNAQIYIGEETAPYFNVDHSAVYIIGNQLYVRDFHVENPSVNFYYWKYPSKIGLTSLQDNSRSDFNTVSFNSNIYDIIVELASVFLSTKEPQTLRDVGFYKQVADQLGISITDTSSFVVGSDNSIKIIQNLNQGDQKQ